MKRRNDEKEDRREGTKTLSKQNKEKTTKERESTKQRESTKTSAC